MVVIINKTRLRGNLQRGFTLAELLIVIVVIAILATVIIIAYNGVQQRANNTARIASAKAAMNALALVSANGRADELLAQIPLDVDACYGKGLTDVNGDGIGDCFYNDNNAETSNIPAVDAIIEDSGGFSNVFYPKITVPGAGGSSTSITAPIIGHGLITIDGQPAEYRLSYFLDGENQDCVLDGVLTTVGHNAYELQDAKNSLSGGGVTGCNIDLSQFAS